MTNSPPDASMTLGEVRLIDVKQVVNRAKIDLLMQEWREMTEEAGLGMLAIAGLDQALAALTLLIVREKERG